MSIDLKTATQEQRTPAPDGVKLPIYMDNHATTPMDPRVLEAMLPYFMEKFGNAASRNHPFGWAAEEAVENAREQIAKLIGATAKEIIFTSGATESDNLAIKGVAEMYREKGNHIITAVTEHKAVLDTCKRLEKYGYRVTYLPVQKDGLVDLEELKRAIDDKTILVTHHGGEQRDRRAAAVARNRQDLSTSAACCSTPMRVQAVGKVPIDVSKDNIDLHVDHRPQDLRSQGCGRACTCAARIRACRFPPHRRRRTRARHAFGNFERPRHRGTGQGM